MRHFISALAAALLMAASCAHVGAQTEPKDDPLLLVSGGGTPVQHLVYAVSYDETTRCPIYVAWRLTKGDLAQRNASREDSEFVPDPDIPATLPTTAYSRTGYDRGHMCPAADCRRSTQAMDESFYTSNICPQDHDLNAGAWLDLEDACRNWARSGETVRIVCGPLFANDAKAAKGRAAVPQAFFKCVLREIGGEYRAAAWIMPNVNENYRGDEVFRVYGTSVDNVEAITGLDFFTALPDEVENAIERCVPTVH